MTASSSDDRTDQVADAAPAAPKKTPARKAPAKKTTGTRAPSKAAADKAAATVEVVAEPALKIDRSSASSGPRSAGSKKTTTAAARAAAVKNSTRDTTARAAAAKSASARSAATTATTAKTAAAKAAAAKTPAAKTAASKTAASGTSNTSAAKTAAAKTAAAKAASEKSAAAKSAARTSAARTAAAKTAAAKAAAAKAAAAKAAAAKESAVEAENTVAIEAVAVDTTGADVTTADADPRELGVTESDTTGEVLEENAAVETRIETPIETPSLPLTTEAAASSDAVAVESEDDATSAPVESTPSTRSADEASADPALDTSPVEGATAEAEPVIESAEEPTVDEDATSEFVDAVSDTDETDEAVGGIEEASGSEAIRIRGLVKSFGDHTAVNGIDLTVPAGSFYGIVGPNGAGKTTTLSIVAGLLRADAGDIAICGIDQSAKPLAAKRMMGVLPDRLRTFDRLTGRQLLYYYGLLRGLASAVIEKRVADLARAFDLGEALNRVVSDYSAGMTKKIMLAGAMIHSPRVLVLDEPFEAVDPVSSAVILDILRAYVSHGGTVVLSSHGMDLVERVCSRVAIIVGGEVLAEGTIDEVRAGQTLEARFVELSGGIGEVEGLEWLHTFSD
ncbi:ABC transporter ATP-binding protein [Microbacterium sp. Leaf161]|uniref:ABC transporter ATP-binding protein n=1 Tax=Microbacterium sp. Leaf161 TaxID=1736281 RepID=UPI001F30B146|nr:ABC transporter ATP-binding protein [Microbacterium sp. Leaf161]